MKKISMILVLLFTTLIVTAQRQWQTENNRKGDEAMKSLDYSSAKIWYEYEVVLNCNPYSINQLKKIWLADPSMHTSMRSVMNQCLECLEKSATQDKDTTSISNLIVYYSEGIGTNKDEAKAEMWAAKLDEIIGQTQTTYVQREVKPQREKVKMEFFAGFAATYEAPFGVTVGGVGRVVGWYLRFRTNMSFQNYDNPTFNLDDSGEPSIIGEHNGSLPDGSLPHFTGKKKYNTYTGTGGLVFKITPSFYLSVGGGIGKKEFLTEYHKIDNVVIDNSPSGSFWAKSGYDDKTSFDGPVVELDGTFKIGKSFYGSLGCTMFDFKYISANAGLGVFF